VLKGIIFTLLLSLVSFGFSVNASATNHYQWITSTNFATVSYDTQSVKYNLACGKSVDVWISRNYTEDGARKWVKDNRAKGIYQETKWDNFSFYLEHWLVSKDSYKTLETIYYDVNGNVLSSTPFDKNAQWENIVPSSKGEEIRNNFVGFLKS